ncbi:MAG TPA: hypothetical protein VL175_03840 [Pirellulales bacterium]|jgi:hypothetical protein|nr:hypothetical protein [Pirellulales bacterium]
MSDDDLAELKQKSAELEQRLKKLRGQTEVSPTHRPEPRKRTVADKFRDLLELLGYWVGF